MAEATGVAVGHAELATLKELALEGALDGRAKVSCAGLAATLGVSNQTVSRRLRDLEDAGLIERDIESDGQSVAVTAAGERRLQGQYADYRRLFDPGAGVDLTGTVTSGMGEGRHYISLSGYMEQFRGRLGYEPFPGTLNVALDEESTRTRARMEAFDPVPIDGWEDDDRTYGPAVCYPAEIETADGRTYDSVHIITPERTHHDDDQLELIAPDRLRDELGLDDGDYLKVHVKEQ